MDTFKRCYIVSLVMLGVFLIPGITTSFLIGGSGIGPGLIGLAFIAVALVPLIRKGGIASQPRLAAGIAAVLAVIFGVMVGTEYYDLSKYGLEGPNGERSPMRSILKIAFFAFFIFCPWLFTALRGISLTGLPPLRGRRSQSQITDIDD